MKYLRKIRYLAFPYKLSVFFLFLYCFCFDISPEDPFLLRNKLVAPWPATICSAVPLLANVSLYMCLCYMCFIVIKVCCRDWEKPEIRNLKNENE